MHYIAVILGSDFPKTSFHYRCLYADQRAKLHDTKHTSGHCNEAGPSLDHITLILTCTLLKGGLHVSRFFDVHQPIINK